MSLYNIDSREKFENFIKPPILSVVHFTAEWLVECTVVSDVLKELLKIPEIKASKSQFGECEAEKLDEIVWTYKVEAVPTILLFRNGKLVDRLDGASAKLITTKIKAHCLEKEVSEKEDVNVSPQKLEDRLKALISRHNVMLFMKGNRDAPRCGFSRTIIQILNETGVSYDTFDILTDEEVRQGLKEYSDWPTYPQLYVKGELIGGLDIIKELKASGDLDATLKA
ncbi:glutaredoxin 3 [Achroia grisella]|uniref:glutaredoxin 3 n=1 Tax=Achroia grisella TaxID=688607 RepID=UPI0027D257A1|nr:glutaredoxin 3 [Achroia grisella]